MKYRLCRSFEHRMKKSLTKSCGIDVRPVQSRFAFTWEAPTGTWDSILLFACVFLLISLSLLGLQKCLRINLPQFPDRVKPSERQDH